MDPLEAVRWQTGRELPEEQVMEAGALPAYQALDVSPVGLEASVVAGRRVLTAQVSTARELMRETSSDELMTLDLAAPRVASMPAPLVTNMTADQFMTNQVGGKSAPAKPLPVKSATGRPVETSPEPAGCGPMEPARSGRLEAVPPKAGPARPRGTSPTDYGPNKSASPPDPKDARARGAQPDFNKEKQGLKPPRPDSDFLEHDKFKSLSPQEQEQVKLLLSKSTNRDDLFKLLDSGKLLMRDLKGQTALHNLHHLAKDQVLADGIDRDEVLNTIIGHMAEPQRIQQGVRGTCAATTIQYMLALQNPGEYSRIVTGLAGKEGVVQLQDGSVLRRNDDTIAKDDSERGQVDRILQASLMQRGAQGSRPTIPDDYVVKGGRRYGDLSEADKRKAWDEMSREEQEFFWRKLGDGGRYDPKDDKVKYKVGDREVAHGGMPMDGAQDTIDAVLGGKRKLKSYDKDTPEGRQEFERNLNRQYAGMFVSIRFGRPGGRDRSHALLVEKIQGGFVHLYNPHGPNQTNRPVEGGPQRNIDGPSRITMTVNEFFSRLEGYVAE